MLIELFVTIVYNIAGVVPKCSGQMATKRHETRWLIDRLQPNNGKSYADAIGWTAQRTVVD